MPSTQANNVTKRPSRTRMATKIFEEGNNPLPKITNTIQKRKSKKPTPVATLNKVMMDSKVKEVTTSRNQAIALDILKNLDSTVGAILLYLLALI